MSENEKRLKLIWRFFGNIQEAIVLVTLLIIACILGSLVPQNADEWFYFHKYGPKLYRLLNVAGVTDIYHSWWFVTLLFLLGLNLLISVLSRFSFKRRLAGRTLAHLGFFIIIMSLLISTFWRQTGFMKIYEGKATDILVRENQQGEPRRLPFKVFLENFSIERYTDTPSGAIKEYKSEVKVIENGQVTGVRTIRVNHPFRYKGCTFYQYDYDHRNLKYTVLQVVKDPAVPLVYVGFILLTLGLLFVAVFVVKRADRQ